MGHVDHSVSTFPLHLKGADKKRTDLQSIYNGIFFVGVLLFYFPDSHILRKGRLSRLEVAKRIDYIGAMLSITGIILL